MKIIKSYIIEYIGTFALVYTILSFQQQIVYEAILSGIVLAILLYFAKKNLDVYVYPTFNPAVTLSHYLKGELNLHQFIIYSIIELFAGYSVYFVKNYHLIKKII